MQKCGSPSSVIADISAPRKMKFGFVMKPSVEVGYEPRSRTLSTPGIETNGGRERRSRTYSGSKGSMSMLKEIMKVVGGKGTALGNFGLIIRASGNATKDGKCTWQRSFRAGDVASRVICPFPPIDQDASQLQLSYNLLPWIFLRVPPQHSEPLLFRLAAYLSQVYPRMAYLLRVVRLDLQPQTR